MNIGGSMNGVDRDEFEAFLARIRDGKHPEFGTLSWDGQRRQITVTVQFDANGVEDKARSRQQALRYLASLTQEERETIDMEITFREGRPVKAVLRGATGDLSPERLKELAERAGLG
jgi:hypothetical protein